MKTQTRWLAACGLALLLAGGCRLEERMVWAPDGTRAAVRLPEGLCLMTADGQLSAPLASNVTAAAWLPDGRALVVVRAIPVSSWDQGARLLPSNEVATVEALARGLLPTMRGALAAAGGDAAAVEDKFIKPLNIQPTEYLLPALVCLAGSHGDELRQLVHSATNNAEAEQALTEPSAFTIHELAVQPVTGGAPLVLARTLLDVTAPRVAPVTPFVAFLRGPELVVAPLAGGTNRLIAAQQAVGSFDWSPDGRALFYAAPQLERWDEGAINLFHLARRTVVDEHGALAGGAVELWAQMAANFAPRVRCLPDGRVLLAGLALQLPAAAASQHSAHFYIVRDATNAPAAIPTPPGALPQDLAGYAPSPDGRRIALATSGSDEVWVLDVASGGLETVAAPRRGKSRTLPAWRNAHELYFAAFPAADARRPEWLRWSPGTAPQVVSRAWHAGALTNLVER